MKSLYETIAGLAYFNNLLKIIDKAEMAERLNSEGHFTLFGPYDGAFGTYSTYDPDDLLHYYQANPLDEILESKKSAQEVLGYILVPEIYTLEDLKKYTAIVSLDGRDIPLTTTNGYIIPGKAFVLNYNIRAKNGIIHVTDEVLRPTI
jgi:uncharacterized surface protein with fasciclin (FAS1) repeats